MKPEQSTIHLVSANLGLWLGPRLPDPVVDSARDYLRANDTARRLRGCWVMVFGDDLHLHLTTFNGDFPAGENPGTYAYGLAKGAALARGIQLGLGPASRDNPLRLAGAKQEAARDLHHLDDPYTERGAEPIFVAETSSPTPFTTRRANGPTGSTRPSGTRTATTSARYAWASPRSRSPTRSSR